MTSNRPCGVCITGVGAVSCAGSDVESLWQAALQRRVRAAWLGEGPAEERIAGCRAPAQLPIPSGMRAVDFRRMDRFAQLGVVAGAEAWHDAALATSSVDFRRVAVISGTSRGPIGQGRVPENRRRVRPTDSVYGSASSLTGALAGLVGARGPSLTVSATCASSAMALGVAALQIQAGACVVALVGGADAPLHPGFLAELQATGVLGTGPDPTTVCRPYDCRRTGITIGEAGAYVVLESTEHARRRGARIRAELVGWSSTCDPGSRSGMGEEGKGVQDALEAALAQARIDVQDVDAVHVHGTGTQVGDAAEGQVLRRLLGSRAEEVAFTSTKPITGHCLGASGALQAVINVKALQEQQLPSTAGCDDPDPQCGVKLLRDEPSQGRLRTILTHSAGFWGNHAGLVFRRV
jgi:3-oxoacyl-[acyl-carrier-protein] synthase II